MRVSEQKQAALFSAIFRTGALLAAAPILAATAAAAAGAGASPWVAATHSKLRLVAGGAEDGAILAGIQLRLDQGWKTYWRTPGDSGVPPSFDWSGSKNLKSVEVLYPAPGRFADANGTTVGYEDEVVFPIKVTPEHAGEPVELKLDVDYGLCKSLCIPDQAKLSLELAPDGSADPGDDLLLGSFLARVPKPATPGELPAITHVEAKLGGDKPELVIDAAFPQGAAATDLFAEAGDSFVPVPKPDGPLKDGKQRFVIDFMSESEVDAIKGKPIRLTLVYDGGAREFTWKP